MIGFLVLGLFVLFMFVNIPIAVSMGLASAIGLVCLDISGTALAQKMVAGVQSWTLLAVPFYILAAQIMNYGGVAERMLQFADELVGWIKGGLAHANVLASMIFAGISGAAVADASGLGLVEIKVMSDGGYDKRFAVGVTAASCMLGPIIPPSIMLIIYGHIAELSIATLWFAGIVPGILTGLILMAYIYYAVARKHVVAPAPRPFSFQRTARSFLQNVFVILLPILLLWSILSGMATPTETGVIACLYTFVLSMIFKGKAFLRKVPEVLIVSAKSSGVIMFIIATATAFVWIMTVERSAVMLSDFLLSLTDNKYLLLVIINIFLLIVGAFLEQIPAMLVIVPLMAPIPAEIGMNPIHFGIMVVFNLMIGMITPPMGMALYIMGAITDVPMREIIVYSMRFFLALVFALLLISYIPIISTFVPQLLGLSMY